MRYVIAYAGNLWEVFAVRVWFAPFLISNAALHGGVGLDWNPTTIAGLSLFVAVSLNLAVAELGVRWGRNAVILAVSIASVVVCGLLGWQASGPYMLFWRYSWSMA